MDGFQGHWGSIPDASHADAPIWWRRRVGARDGIATVLIVAAVSFSAIAAFDAWGIHLAPTLEAARAISGEG